MKKTYITPSIVEVALQQQGLLCQSVRNLSSNLSVNYGGSDEDYISDGGVIRAKESGSLWDEEW